MKTDIHKQITYRIELTDKDIFMLLLLANKIPDCKLSNKFVRIYNEINDYWCVTKGTPLVVSVQVEE